MGDSHAKILMNVPMSTLVPMLLTLPVSTQLVASTAPVTPDGSRAQTDNLPTLTSVTLLLVVLTLPVLTLKAHTNANVMPDTATLLRTPLTVSVKISMSVLSRPLYAQPTVSASTSPAHTVAHVTMVSKVKTVSTLRNVLLKSHHVMPTLPASSWRVASTANATMVSREMDSVVLISTSVFNKVPPLVVLTLDVPTTKVLTHVPVTLVTPVRLVTMTVRTLMSATLSNAWPTLLASTAPVASLASATKDTP